MEKWEGKPVALLGVNSDKDKERVRLAYERHHLNWRSWLIGGTGGPIPRRYGVEGWPSFFIIDAEGILRFKDINPGEIEAHVRGLLFEMGAK